MESLDDGSKSKGFIKHVFNFEEEGKSEMLNIVQYSTISLIPIIILNKLMQKYVPEADENKSSLEVVAEILVQVIFMFIGILLIHRITTYVPTYSGLKYPEFSVIYIILAVLMITMSLQTKLGEKVSLLVERISDLWEGKVNDKKKKKKAPISGQTTAYPITPSTNQSAYTDGTSISQLPSDGVSMSPEQLPNYNSMYKNSPAPMVGAATPGVTESFEPMAANAALGGSFSGFGSW